MMNTQKDTKDTLEEFAHSIELLAETVKDISQIEEEKAMAASQGLHDRMDDFLKHEQVHILKLRGLEQKRLRLAEEMGWAGLTFRQILQQATEQQQQVLTPLFTLLDQRIKHLQDARDSAERIVKVRLREFEYILSIGKDEGYGEDRRPSTLFHDRYV